jgi:monoamine oxidase
MTRKEFVKICTLLGISLPFQSALSACSNSNDDSIMTVDDSEFSGKVLIIGAGPAGMSAGYLLAQHGIDFQILEASANHGGRIRTNTSFANFPIPLGAEWVHVNTNIFSEIVNDSSVNVDIETTMYDTVNDVAIDSATGMQVSFEEAGFTIDSKFINSSWLDFFQTYLYPSIQSKIVYNSPVSSIDYSADQAVVTTSEGQNYSADRVVVAVPVKILQNEVIDFVPSLPSAKQQAIANVTVWSGFKAFFEFDSKFWPTIVGYDIMPASIGQKMYYDASYGQTTNQNILGLFSTGAPAETYIGITNDDDFRDYVLNELDALFNNQATPNYVKHIRQNWNAEPFARAAYVSAYEDASLVNTLGQSVDGKVYFAGDAYTTGEDWSSVHAAARSAIRAVNEILT